MVYNCLNFVSVVTKAAAQDGVMCQNMPKLFADDLTIQCPFSENDCTWYQLRDNVPQPVDIEELVNNSVVLLGESAYSYGEFIVQSSSNESECYTVCPIPTGIAIVK